MGGKSGPDSWADGQSTDRIIVDFGLEGAKSGLQYLLDFNFGVLEFDWEKRHVHAWVRGVQSVKPSLSIKRKMGAEPPPQKLAVLGAV